MLKDFFCLGVRPGNDMNADEFTNAAGCNGARFGSGFHGADVTTDEDRHVTVQEVFLADKNDIRGLDHGVGSLHGPDESPRFNHP